MSSKRTWQEILMELEAETKRDGYFGRKQNLEAIVNELLNELRYVGLLQGDDRNA